VLDLHKEISATDNESLTIRPLHVADLAELEKVFAGAFARLQPFGSLEDPARLDAARRCLRKTVSGGDGPWLEEASFLALDKVDARPVGAIFITLLPAGDAADTTATTVRHAAHDLAAQQGGRAHLTWIFAAPFFAGGGTGTALLAAARAVLCHRGYTQLFSTFLLGNHSSMLWHWRSGFELLPYPFSRRRRWTRREADPPQPTSP